MKHLQSLQSILWGKEERETRKLFLLMRAMFGKRNKNVLRARLEISSADCYNELVGRSCSRRSFAWCDPAKQVMYLARRALLLPQDNLRGLLLHEFGHLADPQWHKAESERRADKIAEEVTGVPIRYDSHNVQTVGKGKNKRPRHLHR